ncbi:syncytin-2 [Sapajus apella]|uniref:Syncytin-2 n=1 Tax=Sapajus apella TaxID=9515 RepID=A0A6J3FK87_SAPAP|nr:syncytin-2 [Sapajus apella]XP_032105836.1 syncytin-2 [Sapajus apella]XP_032105837.1 syncytin-2 [Sapajus apella]
MGLLLLVLILTPLLAAYRHPDFQLLEKAQQLLQSTGSPYSTNCWLCTSSSTKTPGRAYPASSREWTTTEAELHISYQWDPNLKGLIRPANSLLSKVKQDFPDIRKEPPIFGPIFTNVNLIGIAPICVTAKRKDGINVGTLPSTVCNVTLTVDPNEQTYQQYTHNQFHHQPRFPKPPNITFPQGILLDKSTQFCQGRPSSCSTRNFWFQPADYNQCLQIPKLSSTAEWVLLDQTRNSLFWENKTKGANQSQTPCVQVLAGMTIATSYLGISAVSEFSGTSVTPLFSFHISTCLKTQGAFYICGQSIHQCLPTNWTGTCTIGYVSPDIFIVPGNLSLPIPIYGNSHFPRVRRAIHLIPLLVGLGIAGSAGTGIAGIAKASFTYSQLSKEIANNIEAIAKTLTTVQEQMDSLAAVVLQNRRGLDMLTAAQGGICLALDEKCCFWVNQSGKVQDNIRQLLNRASTLREQATQGWLNWEGTWKWFSWVLPFTGPLVSLLLLLLFGPCLLNLITQFVSSRLQDTKLQMKLSKRGLPRNSQESPF